jgi:prepilin-type N-terminal cleavage/methylation domain-containing protein
LRARGFSLIELTVALVIIGLILGMVFLRGGGLIDSSRTANTIELIKGISVGAQTFKSRYHYLPGDLPTASEEIANLSAGCNIAVGTANIGNGQVDTAAEVGCAAEHLVTSGLLKGRTDGFYTDFNSSTLPDALLTARRTAGANPPTFSSSIQNEIQLLNHPCESAQGIDRKLDDGNFATGRVQASVTDCVPNTTNDPVPIIDISI